MSKEIIAWAAGVIAREIENKSYGHINFSIFGGKIDGVKVERSEKPLLDK